jgi:hypothetical protein
MADISMSKDAVLAALGARGGTTESVDAGDPDRAIRARAISQSDKAMKLQKSSMALQIKQIQLQKQQIQLAMLQKRQAAQGGGGGGAGGGGGGVASGVLVGNLLTKALLYATRQSMIVNKSLTFIGKMLGLLVDFILLPFLPPMIDAMIGLSNAVINFGDKWDKAVSGGNFADMITTLMQLPSMLVHGLVGSLGFNIGRWIGENFTDAPLQAIRDMVIDFTNGVIDLWNSWVQFCIDAKNYVLNTLTAGWQDAMDTLSTAAKNMVESIPGVKESKSIAKGVSDFASGKPIGDIVVQVSGTVFKNEIDLYNNMISKMRAELFRWGIGK